MRSRLAICDHCDTVHRRMEIPRGTHAHCQVCDCALYSNRTTNIDALLAISVTALIVFIIANTFPIVTVELGGEQNQTTLWGAILASHESGISFVAGLAALMVFFFPMMLILLSLYIFLPMRFGMDVPGFANAMHLLDAVRPWSMVEVFFLGVLVSLVKLSGDTDVTPAMGLWGFAGLTLLMTLLNSVDMHELWDIHGRKRR